MKKFGSLTHSLPRSGQKEFLLTNQYLSRQKDDENWFMLNSLLEAFDPKSD